MILFYFILQVSPQLCLKINLQFFSNLSSIRFFLRAWVCISLIFDFFKGLCLYRIIFFSCKQIYLLLNFLSFFVFGLTFAGVPKSRRGAIWQLLVEQNQLKSPMMSTGSGLDDVAYDDLMRRLTTHQHAILIDLGILELLSFI